MKGGTGNEIFKMGKHLQGIVFQLFCIFSAPGDGMKYDCVIVMLNHKTRDRDVMHFGGFLPESMSVAYIASIHVTNDRLLVYS